MRLSRAVVYTDDEVAPSSQSGNVPRDPARNLTSIFYVFPLSPSHCICPLLYRQTMISCVQYNCTKLPRSAMMQSLTSYLLKLQEKPPYDSTLLCPRRSWSQFCSLLKSSPRSRAVVVCPSLPPQIPNGPIAKFSQHCVRVCGSEEAKAFISLPWSLSSSSPYHNGWLAG